MKTAGVFIRTKIPEISVGSQMNRSDRNLPFHFRESCSFAVLLFTCILIGIREKKIMKNFQNRIPLGWTGFIGRCHSIFLGYLVSYRSVNSSQDISTISGYYASLFLDFLNGNLSGLAVGDSSLTIVGSQNSPPSPPFEHNIIITAACAISLIIIHSKYFPVFDWLN